MAGVGVGRWKGGSFGRGGEDEAFSSSQPQNLTFLPTPSPSTQVCNSGAPIAETSFRPFPPTPLLRQEGVRWR